MNDLALEFPEIAHKDSANQFKQDFFACNETVINGSALFDQMDYDDWLINIERNYNLETVSKDWVQAVTFFAVRACDRRIVGMIDIRHNLHHAFLAEYGGHIGYAVRPDERRKGYATKMLKLALEYARSTGLEKVMLGCYSDNEGSIKTILNCGGTLTETKIYADGKPMNIYWIDL